MFKLVCSNEKALFSTLYCIYRRIELLFIKVL